MSLDPGFAIWIVRSLRRIMRAVDMYSHRLSADYNITSPQLLVLRTLQDDGPLTPGTLAKLVHLSPSTVVGILNRLEQKQLAVRERSMKDRRQVLVHITASGIDLVRSVPSPLQTRLSEGLANLSEEELITIGRSLERLVNLLELDQSEDTAPLLDIGPIADATAAGPDEPITPGDEHHA
jgi:DNA-binding MarR family transcriptional regulator